MSSFTTFLVRDRYINVPIPRVPSPDTCGETATTTEARDLGTIGSNLAYMSAKTQVVEKVLGELKQLCEVTAFRCIWCFHNQRAPHM